MYRFYCFSDASAAVRMLTAADANEKRMGLSRNPIRQMTSSLDGGVMGEGGCPSRGEVSAEPSAFLAECRSHSSGI